MDESQVLPDLPEPKIQTKFSGLRSLPPDGAGADLPLALARARWLVA